MIADVPATTYDRPPSPKVVASPLGLNSYLILLAVVDSCMPTSDTASYGGVSAGSKRPISSGYMVRTLTNFGTAAAHYKVRVVAFI